MEIDAASARFGTVRSHVRRDAVWRLSKHPAAVVRCAPVGDLRPVGHGRTVQVRFDRVNVVSTASEATKYLCPLCVTDCMLGLLQLGGIGTVPAILAGLVLIAIVMIIARIVMKVAWRLVIIAIIAVGTLWLLGVLGFGVL